MRINNFELEAKTYKNLSIDLQDEYSYMDFYKRKIAEIKIMGLILSVPLFLPMSANCTKRMALICAGIQNVMFFKKAETKKVISGT